MAHCFTGSPPKSAAMVNGGFRVEAFGVSKFQKLKLSTQLDQTHKSLTIVVATDRSGLNNSIFQKPPLPLLNQPLNSELVLKS